MTQGVRECLHPNIPASTSVHLCKSVRNICASMLVCECVRVHVLLHVAAHVESRLGMCSCVHACASACEDGCAFCVSAHTLHI